ncbi:hypothetical protein [Virgibacillus ndiopensis]|uniref:hypothetical protein n=1 Tax=Virgibacillus ndiopensis TaxID=2004408 RepID=UPI000C07D78D|nr:hypothetical protein [Virgibacillus ndiopensis]
MNLNNFKVHATHSSGVSQFNVSTNGQFIVQRKIFSDIYPDFPNLLTFKVYIYLCKSYEWKFQRVKKAKTQIQQDLNLSRVELNHIIDWLETHFFIKRTNRHNQQMYQAKLLTAPDYDPYTNTYISCEDIPFHTGVLKDRNQGYIMIPSDAVTTRMLMNTASSNRDWTYLKLKVFLNLYAHCWLEYFGGVNPDTIKVNQVSNKIEVDPAFFFNMKGSEKQVIRSIETMIGMSLLVIVDVSFVKGVYVGDKPLLPPQPRSAECCVLRPVYLSSKKVFRQELDSKRRWMIL